MTNLSGVFGQNLRLLCERDGTPSGTAKKLGISHVQMHRYLRGESYPKPTELKKICDHFQSDARILIEPLPLKSGGWSSVLDKVQVTQAQRRLLNAILYAAPNHDYMPDESMLPDGGYIGWASSMAYPGKVTRNVYKVQTVDGARTAKTHEPIDLFPELKAARGAGVAWRSPRQREVRGAVLTSREGVSIISCCPPPIGWISMRFLSPSPSLSGKVLSGLELFSRKEYVGVQRLARIVWEPLPPTFSALLRAARLPTWMEVSEVPDHIAAILSLPVG